jgi:hypothetical protein
VHHSPDHIELMRLEKAVRSSQKKLVLACGYVQTLSRPDEGFHATTPFIWCSFSIP